MPAFPRNRRLLLAAGLLICVALAGWLWHEPISPGKHTESAAIPAAPGLAAAGRTAEPLEPTATTIPSSASEGQEGALAAVASGARLALDDHGAWAFSQLELSIGRGPFPLSRLPTRDELDVARDFGFDYTMDFRGGDGNIPRTRWTPLDRSMGLSLGGLAPLQVELGFPGFLPFSGTYSADQARASLDAPIRIELEPAAKLLLLPPAMDPLPGLDLEIRASAAALPWLRPVPAAFATWPTEPIAVPAGPLELWCRLPDGRQACQRLPPLAIGELRTVQPLFSGPSAYLVRLAFAPGGAPVSGGKVFLLQGSTPSAYEQGNHNIHGPSSGVVLAADGQLSLPSLPAGLYRLIYGNPQTAMVAPFEVLFPEDHGRTVELPAPGSLVGQVRGLGEHAAEAAVKLTPKRSPANGPTALLESLMSSTGLRAGLNPAGEFVLSPLAAGSYAVALEFPNQNGPSRALGELEIRPAEQSRFEAEAAPPAGGQVVVQVRIDGQPAVQRSVELLDLEDRQQRHALDHLGAMGRRIGLKQALDPAGTAHFQGVPPSRYAVVLGNAQLAECEVFADQVTRLDLHAFEGRAYLQLRFAGARPQGKYQLELRRRGRLVGWTVAVDGADQAYMRDLTGAFEARIYGFAGDVAVPFELPPGDGRVEIQFGP